MLAWQKIWKFIWKDMPSINGTEAQYLYFIFISIKFICRRLWIILLQNLFCRNVLRIIEKVLLLWKEFDKFVHLRYGSVLSVFLILVPFEFRVFFGWIHDHLFDHFFVGIRVSRLSHTPDFDSKSFIFWCQKPITRHLEYRTLSLMDIKVLNIIFEFVK